MRRTKIVATIGPASSSDAAIRELIAAGVDVFRVNFSHGTHDAHKANIARIRNAAGEAGRAIAVLQDLSGPKIRTGLLEGGQPLELNEGQELRIGIGNFVGHPGRVSTSYADLFTVVHAGDTLLLDDGRLQLTVQQNDGSELRTVVVDGGPLGEHKGINAPGVALPSAGLTAKDEEDLRFGVSVGVDLVAMSFVQTAADLRQLRAALERLGAPATPIVAKLERPEAVARLEEILQACDAVMVARGDLGLEVPLEHVPRIQKETTRRARALGVPVIIATQVFDSMRTEPRPTRAEVSDAANAVDDGVDAVMLSGETAVGSFPVRVVQTLDRVIRDAESIPSALVVPLESSLLLPEHGRAICEAAVTLAERSEAAAILAMTRGGRTARVLSGLRPRVPIIAVTDSQDAVRRLTLLWGVVPVVEDFGTDLLASATRVAANLVGAGTIPPASMVVIVNVIPGFVPGMRLYRIPG
jgi:pyruvate kinase